MLKEKRINHQPLAQQTETHFCVTELSRVEWLCAEISKSPADYPVLDFAFQTKAKQTNRKKKQNS